MPARSAVASDTAEAPLALPATLPALPSAAGLGFGFGVGFGFGFGLTLDLTVGGGSRVGNGLDFGKSLT